MRRPKISQVVSPVVVQVADSARAFTSTTGTAVTVYPVTSTSLTDACQLARADFKRYPHNDLAALEKLSEFKGESSERTWLTAILKYKVIEVYRKRNSAWLSAAGDHEPEPEYFDPDNGHWKEVWGPRPMPLDHGDPTLQKELAGILQKCLQKLPALWRSIFSMKHMDETATEVICEELKVTPSNYWVIIHRAKVNLRACIQKEYA